MREPTVAQSLQLIAVGAEALSDRHRAEPFPVHSLRRLVTPCLPSSNLQPEVAAGMRDRCLR